VEAFDGPCTVVVVVLEVFDGPCKVVVVALSMPGVFIVLGVSGAVFKRIIPNRAAPNTPKSACRCRPWENAPKKAMAKNQ